MFPSKTKNSLLRTFLILLMMFLFIGCSAHVSLTKKDRSLIQSVSINKHIPKPYGIYYQGSREVHLGGYAEMIGTERRPKSMLKYIMEKDQIDIAQIVREQFTDELRKSKLFNSIVDEKGDAEFWLFIRDYGFSVPHYFTTKLKPYLILRGILVEPDGSFLWEKQAAVVREGETPSYTLKEYLKNSELIREALTFASQIAVRDLINDMLRK